ncbi:MAG: hypothetical protein H0X29_10960 [Parachlamydiaceae bacterium]|nr:hypothetical protein [Parachlamydiaceae bacterium]
MSSSQNIACRHDVLHVNPCQPKENNSFDFFVSIIEKMSAIALGVFSNSINSKLFVPSFFVGMVIGVYSYFEEKKSCQEIHPVSSCAHGLLEQLTGVKLPPIVSLVANLAVTVCHIEHHEAVFVPIIGISLGSWAGKTAANYGVLINKNINIYLGDKSLLPN